jgi:hypothetical protein
VSSPRRLRASMNLHTGHQPKERWWLTVALCREIVRAERWVDVVEIGRALQKVQRMADELDEEGRYHCERCTPHEDGQEEGGKG